MPPSVSSEYRAQQYLMLRPVLWAGGHHFKVLDQRMLWCLGCYQAVPRWAIDERLWMPMIGRWCPGMFRAITERAGPDGTGPDPDTLFHVEPPKPTRRRRKAPRG